jgi:hypothetical protein
MSNGLPPPEPLPADLLVVAASAGLVLVAMIWVPLLLLSVSTVVLCAPPSSSALVEDTGGVTVDRVDVVVSLVDVTEVVVWELNACVWLVAFVVGVEVVVFASVVEATTVLLVVTGTDTGGFVAEETDVKNEGRIVVNPLPRVLEEVVVELWSAVGHRAAIIPPLMTIPSKVLALVPTVIQDVVTCTANTLSAVWHFIEHPSWKSDTVHIGIWL